MTTPAGSDSPRWLRALCGKPGAWISGLWGLAEGTLFFVVPDVAFTRTTLVSPARGLLQLGTAVIGALVAGAVMYAWADAAPAQARATVAAVPFVGEKLVTPADQRWQTDGHRALFDRPLGGVPYKVYAVLAPSQMSMGMFLLASAAMRIERMILSWIVFAPAAWVIARLDGRRSLRVATWFHAAFWIVVYAVYWSQNA